MRLVTVLRDGQSRVCGVRADGYIDLHEIDPALPASMKELLALGPTGLSQAAAAIRAGQPFKSNNFRLLAPVPDPQKVICIGLNYADHAAESGAAIPAEPVVFCKFPTAVRGANDDIILPEASTQVDYEAELVVIIGKTGRHIPPANAFEYIAGFACGHDVSARDWQLHKPGGQWLLGKTFDSFAPFGPELVTPDEVPNPHALDISLRLNGQLMQSSNTRQLIFSIDQLIAYVSGVCTLMPGDVIFTGTPPGVGAARKPPVFLQPGDVVEVEIQHLGILRNPVVAESRTD